jgi:hypothetical protein
MTELQKEELENYFKPIYYVEYEEKVAGELFPRIFRMGYYNKRNNKKEALRAFEELNGARVIEKSMRTGQEKVIRERETA